jgi:hypothetical protein
MEGASKHQVVVDGEFVQSRVEVPLVYESASSIDDDQRKDDPADIRQSESHAFQNASTPPSLTLWGPLI